MTGATAGANLTTEHMPAGAMLGPVRVWWLRLTARAATDRWGCGVSGS